MKMIALFISILSAGTLATASVTHECGQGTVRAVSYGYCIDRPAADVNDADVFVYFHGIYGSEQQWSQLTAIIQAISTARAGHMPTVISLSLGPAWLLSEFSPNANPSSYRTLVDEILPVVEAKLAVPVQHRTLIGQSMGGFNSAQLLGRDPHLFERVALICPAVSTLSPFSTDPEIAAYLARHPEIDPSLLRQAQFLTKMVYPTPQDYLPHNPLTIAAKLSAASPRIFVSAGTADEFGFYDGAVEFAKEATAGGANVTSIVIPQGRHCQQNAQSLDLLGQFLK